MLLIVEIHRQKLVTEIVKPIKRQFFYFQAFFYRFDFFYDGFSK